VQLGLNFSAFVNKLVAKVFVEIAIVRGKYNCELEEKIESPK